MQRSLKSETVDPIVDDGSQIKRVNWDNENIDSQVNDDGNNAIKNEPSNERLSGMRQQFAGTGTGSSSIEDRFCCTNMALMVYKKAWEGARKALPRATRSQNSNLDNSSSVDGRRAITSRDPNRTISIESEDDLTTECSFEYDEDGDLRSELGDQPLRRRGKDNERPTTLRGLERLSTDTEEFAEDETNSGPEDVDLESFKRVYMSDLVIPEEPDKESAAVQQESNQLKSDLEDNNNTHEESNLNSDGSKWRRRFKLDGRFNNKLDESIETIEPNNNIVISEETTGSNETKESMSEPDKPMSMTDIERFVQVTCDQVMEKVREEGDFGTEDDLSVRGSGIFKMRPGVRNEDSLESRASTDVTISTIEIPTITITEDQLDDSSVVLSEITVRDETGSEGACDELPEDGSSGQGVLKGKATALKFKVKKLGSKVKDIFKRGTTPEVSPVPSPVGEYIDIEEEKRRRKEEEKEAERRRKEEETARKEEERRQKEEIERQRKAEEMERKALELQKKLMAEAAKELERQKKEEAKRRKEDEERAKKEEERQRKEEEKARKEEEKARREEEKRIKAEEEKRRKEEEKRRKEEEKMRKMREEEERRRLKEEEETRRKLREVEEKRQREKEEEERRRKQAEEEEEARRRRRQQEEEEEERRRKEEEESAKLRETLKRKLEDELMNEGLKDDDEVDITRPEEDEDNNNEVSKNDQDDPYYVEDGNQEVIRRASSPSLVSGHASIAISKSTSQATIMITSPPSNREKRSPSRDEETFGQAGESEGDIEPHMGGRKRKKMRKRLRDTKNKLINLKSKAIEALPSISTFKSRVKDILPVRSGQSGQDENGKVQNEMDPRFSIHREQKIFSEYRKRYPDSENEFFSDSELVESRKSTLKAISPDLEQGPGGMYEEIETSTEDRVQLLLSPINSPLRPPRRSDYGGGNKTFHASEPNISRTGTPKKPKRAPPPRPPPPEIEIYLTSELDPSREGSTTTSIGALEEIDLNSSNRDLSTQFSSKNEPEKMPASIYYRKVVRDWQERHLKRMDELISSSSPNLEVYQRPPRSGRHPPRVPPHPSSNSRPQPLPRRRLSRASLLRQKIRDQQAEESMMNKENIDGYEVLPRRIDHPLTNHSGLPPLPPPRFRSDRHTPMSKSPFSTLHRLQQQQKQQQQQQRLIQQDYLLSVDRANLATDGLYWKPFSWKTGRCRSLTELYVRKRSQPPIIIDTKPSEAGSENSLSQEPVERSLSYRLMSQYCSPPRPPPPTIKSETPSDSLQERLSEGKIESSEPIYSTIDRTKKLKRDLDLNNTSNGELIQNRPLPAPPLPPRSKRKNSMSRSRSNSPYLSLTGSSVDLNRPEATLIRPVSPYPIVGMVDVSVETGSQLINYPRSLESKECQTSLEDLANKNEKNDLHKLNESNLRLPKDTKFIHLDCTEEFGYADDGRESITPTPTTISQVAIKVTPEREVFKDGYKHSDVNLNQLKRTRLSSSSSKDSSPPLVTASSGSLNVRSKVSPAKEFGRADDEASSRTVTNYYDAEECDTDMDTFADLDSLSTEATQTLTASTQFHSVLSEPPTISSSLVGTTSHYDTDQVSSKTMEIPTPPEDPAPQPPTADSKSSGNMTQGLPSSSTLTSSPTAVPLVAEHVTIEEDSDDDMLQPRVASPSAMRAYMSSRRVRPDSMDASDPEW